MRLISSSNSSHTHSDGQNGGGDVRLARGHPLVHLILIVMGEIESCVHLIFKEKGEVSLGNGRTRGGCG